jgi:hypothetical protein
MMDAWNQSPLSTVLDNINETNPVVTIYLHGWSRRMDFAEVQTIF